MGCSDHPCQKVVVPPCFGAAILEFIQIFYQVIHSFNIPAFKKNNGAFFDGDA